MTATIRRIACGVTIGLVLGLPGVARGQEPTATPQAEASSSEYVLTTQFLEAIQGEKWQEAKQRFIDLRRDYPQAVTQDRRLLYLYAKAQFASGELEPSEQTLVALLEDQENHIDGLYLLAKIYAKKGDKDKQAQARVKDLLVQAARAGQLVLRDIQSKDGQTYFKPLLSDPKFILAVMSAPNEATVNPAGLRNPFRNPLKLAGSEVEGPREDPLGERRQELEARIEALFKEIVQLYQDRQHEEMVTKFAELRQIMAEYGQAGTDEVRRKLEKWNQKLSELGEVRLSIKLQVYINEGNRYLKTMADAIRDEQYDVAIENFSHIEETVEDMRAEEREVFHRNADQLYLRGQALYDKARRLKKISEFKLIVTGVVVAPQEEGSSAAIINDRIYRENDTIFDQETDEEIDGLQVTQIERSTVRFKYEDTEFVRELKAQNQ